MENFKVFDAQACDWYINRRAGETKLGEEMDFAPSLKALKELSAQYVVFGVPEDIGIQANYGKPGASKTWDAFLSSFLNIQVNAHNDPKKCTVLGHIRCDELLVEAARILEEAENPQKQLGKLVQEIDSMVTTVVQTIVAMGKIPIIIGGGHNNAYGNSKGASLALKKPVNVLNIDAHTDLRRTDYRHSGNGFSFAKQEGYIENYAMFGIHKNYTPQYIFEEYEGKEEIEITLYEDIMAGSLAFQQQELERAIRVLDGRFGLELDTDAIAYFNSSAKTPSGFSLTAIRHFINFLKKKGVLYFHIAEAADSGDGQVGKALSYLVSDFIR